MVPLDEMGAPSSATKAHWERPRRPFPPNASAFVALAAVTALVALVALAALGTVPRVDSLTSAPFKALSLTSTDLSDPLTTCLLATLFLGSATAA
jgi:hypothetical protein